MKRLITIGFLVIIATPSLAAERDISYQVFAEQGKAQGNLRDGFVKGMGLNLTSLAPFSPLAPLIGQVGFYFDFGTTRSQGQESIEAFKTNESLRGYDAHTGAVACSTKLWQTSLCLKHSLLMHRTLKGSQTTLHAAGRYAGAAVNWAYGDRWGLFLEAANKRASQKIAGTKLTFSESVVRVGAGWLL